MKEIRIAEIGTVSYQAMFEDGVLLSVKLDFGSSDDSMEIMTPEDVKALVEWLSKNVLQNKPVEQPKIPVNDDLSDRKVGIPGVQVFDMSSKLKQKETVKFTVPKGV